MIPSKTFQNGVQGRVSIGTDRAMNEIDVIEKDRPNMTSHIF